MSMPSSRRPFGVTLVMVLVYISAILNIVAGVLLITLRNNDDVQLNTDLATGSLLIAGIVQLAVGVITFLVAGGLRRGSNFSRFVVAFFTLLSLIGGVYIASAWGSQNRISGIVQAAFAVIILLVLYSNAANRFFMRR